MLVRTWVAPLALLMSSCRPEAGIVSRSGVYDVTTEISTSGLRGLRHVVGGSGLSVSPGIAAEVLAADVIQARSTHEWTDAGACTWLTDCKLVRDYTYTLREGCDECSLDERLDRVRALYAAEQQRPGAAVSDRRWWPAKFPAGIVVGGLGGLLATISGGGVAMAPFVAMPSDHEIPAT